MGVQSFARSLVVRDPDCEMLSFEVWDDVVKDIMIGYFAVRLCDIREGVRPYSPKPFSL